MICHDVEPPERGAEDFFSKPPAFQDIVCRYRQDPNAASRLSSIVGNEAARCTVTGHCTGQVTFETMYPGDLNVSEVEPR